MQALAEGDFSSFVEFLKDFLIISVSYHHIREKTPEEIFHPLVLGMLGFCCHSTHHVRSNRESGYGRYDIALEPKKKGIKAFIIELKKAEEDEELKEVARKALNQIHKRKYKTDPEARGATDIVLVGMAFRGREVEIIQESSRQS